MVLYAYIYKRGVMALVEKRVHKSRNLIYVKQKWKF